MISPERLLALEKNDLPKVAETLAEEEIHLLVGLLSEKDNELRYQALLLLQNRSSLANDVYPYWDQFREKLKSPNSYQRSIGLMLIAFNTRWDTENKMEATIDDYLALLNDEKPITVRQCIQALSHVLPYKPHLLPIITKNLMAVDLSAIKETMRKLVLIDILNILLEIRKVQTTDEIESYISNALTGNILDKKAKKQVELVL